MRSVPYCNSIHIYISLGRLPLSTLDLDGSLLMVMHDTRADVPVRSPTGAQQLLIGLRLQMRTAILCTCIYIQYGKKCVCVCVLCVHARYVCWYIKVGLFSVLSSLHLYCSLFTV